MKRIFYTILVAFAASVSVLGQEIPMDLYIIDKNKEIPDYSFNTLQTRLEQVLTQSGIKSGKDFATFSMVAEPLSISKNIVTGLNNTIVATIDINLFVANNFTGDRFFSGLTVAKANGKTEDKAINKAFSSISLNDPTVSKFLEDAKAKILRYYDENYLTLIAEAKNYASLRQYEKGLCLLGSVPVFIKNYEPVKVALLDVWAQYINFDGRTNLQKARTVWNAGQNREAAAEAAPYLAKIYPDADCYNEAVALNQEINARIGDEWNMLKKIQQDEVNLESQRIEAARAVGVAYGNNQKPTTYVDHWCLR